MNPPYGRIRLDQEERARWSHAVYGHANRYGLFMAGAASQIRDGGVLSALVPAGWLGGSYFQRLRAHLAVEAPLHRVAYVRARACGRLLDWGSAGNAPRHLRARRAGPGRQVRRRSRERSFHSSADRHSSTPSDPRPTVATAPGRFRRSACPPSR
jgi:hypothetical protein